MVTGAVVVVDVSTLPPPRLRHQSEPLGVARQHVPFVVEPGLLRELHVVQLHKCSFWLPIRPAGSVRVWQHPHCCAGDARGVTATMLLADVAADEQSMFMSPDLSVPSNSHVSSVTDPSLRSI